MRLCWDRVPKKFCSIFLQLSFGEYLPTENFKSNEQIEEKYEYSDINLKKKNRWRAMRSQPFVGLEMRGVNPWQSKDEQRRRNSLSRQPLRLHCVSRCNCFAEIERWSEKFPTVRRPKWKRRSNRFYVLEEIQVLGLGP